MSLSLLKHEPATQLRNKSDTHIVQKEALRFVLWGFCLFVYLVVVKKGSWENGLSHMVTKEIKTQAHEFFCWCFCLRFAVEEIFGWLSDSHSILLTNHQRQDFSVTREGCHQARLPFGRWPSLCFWDHNWGAVIRGRSLGLEDEFSVGIWFSQLAPQGLLPNGFTWPISFITFMCRGKSAN